MVSGFDRESSRKDAFKEVGRENEESNEENRGTGSEAKESLTQIDEVKMKKFWITRIESIDNAVVFWHFPSEHS